MGTRHWHHIPYCIDVCVAVLPRRVLDVAPRGIRWAPLLCEAVEAQFAIRRDDDAFVRLETLTINGNGAPDAALPPGYDACQGASGLELSPQLAGRWNLILCDRILHDHPKAAGLAFLHAAIERGDYVVATVPLGEFGAGRPQQSCWTALDFADFPIVRNAVFHDAHARPYGTFVLSKNDPCDIAELQLPSESLLVDQPVVTQTSPGFEAILSHLRDVKAELRYVQSHSTAKLAARFRRSAAFRLLRWLRNRDSRMVTLRAIGTRDEQAEGAEVWVARALPNAGEDAVPWDFCETSGEWVRRPAPTGMRGEALVSWSGTMRVPVDRDPELVLLTHRWGGRVEIAFQSRTETIDLYADPGDRISVFPARTPMVVGVRPPSGARARSTAGSPTAGVGESRAEFIRTIQEAGCPPVAVHCPRWLGVSQSTRRLFEHRLCVPDDVGREPKSLTDAELAEYCETLLASGTRHVVFSGGDDAHFRLAALLRDRDLGIRCDLLSHGNFVQFSDEYSWLATRRWVDGARAGLIHTIGTVKMGMDEFYRSLGVRSKVVLNYIDEIPSGPSSVDAEPWQCGVWVSGTIWKSPYPMLAALKLVPGAKLHAAGLGERARGIVDYLGVPVSSYLSGHLPHADLLERMRRTHLTLYVTFCECCPMVPLESLSVGVPCLLGPTSHLFEDNPFLFERLVVPFPDRADCIARYARRALEERDAIVAEYIRYAPVYNAAARQSVRDFLA